MLMQNFKSAADLGISDDEHRSLVLVMGMFERGEIATEKFHMVSVESPCGTKACILGWCLRVGGPDVFNAFTLSRNWPLYNGLFMYGDDRRYDENDPSHAAAAIRSYLTTGDARWDLAVA